MKHVCHDERMSGVGVRAEEDHEGMRNHFSLILLLIAQDIGGIRRDGGCGLNEAICLFLGVMMVGGTEADHEGMRNHFSLILLLIA